MATKDQIKIEASIEENMKKVWEYWTKPEHITKWNHASEEWLCPSAENDLKEGGKFVYRMEAKDGSFGFDFSGTYKEVNPKKKLVYEIEDGRMVTILFSEEDNTTTIKQTFEPETENSKEMQKEGWQAILNTFKKYAENQN